MKQFKRYKSFKELIRSSYEIYLNACQDEILHLESINLFYLDVIKHYEELLISNSVEFVPLVLLEELPYVRQSKVFK